MAFPTTLDAPTDPSAGQFLNSPSHSSLHTATNASVKAIEAKIGIDGSAVTTSFDYKLSGVTGSDKAASKTGAETLTNKTLTTPIISTISNTGALTLPTSTDTLVGRATTDTLTNKTLTSAKANQFNDTNGAVGLVLTPTGSAVNGVAIVNSATGSDPTMKPTGSDSTRNLNLQGKGTGKTVTIGVGALTIFPFDYIASGCIITADNVGVNKNYSISSGVVVINGNPLTFAGVSAQTVGASQDRYIDFADNGDGTVSVTNTEVANNSASPSLTANNLRNGIVVAGATTITATTSINQGQETRILPIASSIPYAVTDSLGNLICPRDSTRKLLGYRQLTAANFNGANNTSNQDVPGLNMTINVPTSRKIKLSCLGSLYNSGTTGPERIFIVEGATTLANGIVFFTATLSPVTCEPFAITTPSAGSHTYKIQVQAPTSGTPNIEQTTTEPSFIIAELE